MPMLTSPITPYGPVRRLSFAKRLLARPLAEGFASPTRMAYYTITSVPTSSTLAISPGWAWRGLRGRLLVPAGSGGGLALPLTSLVGRTVTIGRAFRADGVRLVCEVYLDGVPLAAPLPCPTA